MKCHGYRKVLMGQFWYLESWLFNVNQMNTGKRNDGMKSQHGLCSILVQWSTKIIHRSALNPA